MNPWVLAALAYLLLARPRSAAAGPADLALPAALLGMDDEPDYELIDELASGGQLPIEQLPIGAPIGGIPGLPIVRGPRPPGSPPPPPPPGSMFSPAPAPPAGGETFRGDIGGGEGVGAYVPGPGFDPWLGPTPELGPPVV